MLDLALYYTIRERHRLASQAGKPGGLQRLPEASVPSLYQNQPRTGATAGKCPSTCHRSHLPPTRTTPPFPHLLFQRERVPRRTREPRHAWWGADTVFGEQSLSERTVWHTARCRHTGGTNPTQYEAHYDPDSWMKTSLHHSLATDSHWGLELHSHVSRPLTRRAQLQPPPTHGRAGRPSACAPRAPLVCG